MSTVLRTQPVQIAVPTSSRFNRSKSTCVVGVVLLTLLVGACGHSDTILKSGDVAGTYTLVQLNDLNLPGETANPKDSCDRVRVIAGFLKVDENGRYKMSLALQFQSSCGQPFNSRSIDVQGVYALSGGSITFTPDDDGWFTTQGTLNRRGIRLVPRIPPRDSDSEVLKSFTFEK